MQLVVTRLDVPSYVLIDINLFKDLAFVFVDHFLLLFAVDVFYLIYLSLWLKKKKKQLLPFTSVYCFYEDQSSARKQTLAESYLRPEFLLPWIYVPKA